NGTYLGGGTWRKVGVIANASGPAGTPVLITTTNAHGLRPGDQVTVWGLGGNYSALDNSSYYVKTVSSTGGVGGPVNQFTLDLTMSDGSGPTANGFWYRSNNVLLKSGAPTAGNIGTANLSGLDPIDQVTFFDHMPFVLNSVNPHRMLLGY